MSKLTKVTVDNTEQISLEEKRQMLRDIELDDVFNTFQKKYLAIYKEPEQKINQQINITVTQIESDFLKREALQNTTGSLSSYLRERVVNLMDLGEWYEHAKSGYAILNSDDYNEKVLQKRKMSILKELEKEYDDDEAESPLFLNNKLKEIESKLKEVTREKRKPTHRISIYVTFDESYVIKWRAAQLSLTVSDYLRFMLFEYKPFTEADKHMTVEGRKKFYSSVINTFNSGWKEPPRISSCMSCVEYQNEIEILKKQILKYQKILEKYRK